MTASSPSGGIPGEEEADSVVDPPLDDREESPFGPPGVRFNSMRRGEGGEMAGVVGTDPAELADGVAAAGLTLVRVAERFFCAFSGTL